MKASLPLIALVPARVVTWTSVVVASGAVGTVTRISVASGLTTKSVVEETSSDSGVLPSASKSDPLASAKPTDVAPLKFEPKICMDVPAVPLCAESPVTTGTGPV